MNIHGCKVANTIPFLVIETVSKSNITFKNYKMAYRNNTDFLTGPANPLAPIVCADISSATTV